MNHLYGNDVSLTEKTLDLLWERQNVTANNIANVDTPGYKAKRVTFENALADSIGSSAARSDAAHVERAIDSTSSRVLEDPEESSRLDGNNVDMDQEQVQLVKTTYEYEMMVNSANNSLKRLDSAAKSF
ncbi:MAG: flagellar basal body rod protein FlgB [Lachnospiraceae bacterium]|jgi:flagellar basal-body rod protein FlgB|nr:flagellar basal body rod protein FlgB [Lachnospiraceae bacterium]